MKIYTVGYAHWTAAALAKRLEEMDAYLFDIRYVANSHRAEFNEYQLYQRMGTRYRRLASWGNANYRGGPIKIASFRVGMELFQRVAPPDRPAILMCQCADHDTCHRAVVADMLRQAGYEVEELLPGDAAVDIRAISLWQPWASLVAWREKRYETRDWATIWTGQLAIHATKVFPYEARQECLITPFRQVLTAHGIHNTNELPLGAIVAVAECNTCHRVTPAWLDAKPLSEQERAFGDFSPGRVAWELTNVRALPEPIPCRGAMGLWTPDSQTVAAVNAALSSFEVAHGN